METSLCGGMFVLLYRKKVLFHISLMKMTFSTLLVSVQKQITLYMDMWQQYLYMFLRDVFKVLSLVSVISEPETESV